MSALAAQTILEGMLAIAITRAIETGAAADRVQEGKRFAYFDVLSWAKNQAEVMDMPFADPGIAALDPYSLLGQGVLPAFSRGPEPTTGEPRAHAVLEQALELALEHALESRAKAAADPFEAGALQGYHELIAFALTQARARGLAFANRTLAAFDPNDLLKPAKQTA